MEKGQVYPRTRDYGNWHEIQFGNSVVYVHKSQTEPTGAATLRNENNNRYSQSGRSVQAKQAVIVYDNTSGSLVPFATIMKGESYPIVGSYGPNWYRIVLADRVGYIRSNEVNLAFSRNDQYFRVMEDNVPIYDNSSGSLVQVGTLEKDQVYPRVRDYGNWHEITYGRGFAYVHKPMTQPADRTINNENSGRFSLSQRNFMADQDLVVYDNTSGSLVPFATIKKGKSYPFINYYGANWYRIDVAGRIGFVRSAQSTLSFLASDRYFEVMQEGLTVYTNSTGRLLPVAQLKEGQVFLRIRHYGNWHEIQFGEEKGYVLKTETRPPQRITIRNQNNNRFSLEQKYFTPKSGVTVYDNTSGSLVAYATLLTGIAYPVVGDYGANWFRVLVGDRVGFVRKNEVNLGEWKFVNQYTLPVYRSFNELADFRQHLHFYNPSYVRYFELDFGDFVEILDTNRYGAHIRTTNNQMGWVQYDYLVESVQNPLWLVKEARNMRIGPGTPYSVSGTVSAQARVRVLDYMSGSGTFRHWYHVQTSSGQQGWIWGARSSNNTESNVVRYEFNQENRQVDFLTPYTPLKSSSSVNAADINRFIAANTSGTTLMTGMGQSFIEAANLTGLNPIYLVAHAAHETGWGRSAIAQQKYNYYGIGAIDSRPLEGAFDYDTPESGIIAGALWISRNYIHSDRHQQTTLDNMRNNKGSHQYATDEAWHVKIVEISQRFYRFMN